MTQMRDNSAKKYLTAGQRACPLLLSSFLRGAVPTAADLPADIRKVRTEEYIDLLLSIMNEGRSVSLLIAGGSMTPFLADGRDHVVLEKPFRELSVGDIVLFRRQNGEYVLHRIKRISGENYYMVGDAQTYIEGPVRKSQIAALATAVERKGKVLKSGDAFWDFFERIWIRMVLFRPVCIKVYSIYCNIARKGTYESQK